MSKKINALVVGAGHFGINHARILCRLNGKKIPDIPVMDTLVVSRTDLTAAGAATKALQQDSHRSALQVVAAQIDSVSRLKTVLKKYKPQLISICARDRIEGDSIHARYTAHALKYGAVLCEKPFSEAAGDGSSLAACRALLDESHAGWFGLELPMAVVARDMLSHDSMQKLFDHAKKIRIYWAAEIQRKNTLINDLALHPWSLLHPLFHLAVDKVESRGREALIHLQLTHRTSGHRVEGQFILKNSGTFRGITVDETTFAIQSSADGVTIIRLDLSLETAAQLTAKQLKGQITLEVHNPLEQNIVAVLQHRPLVDMKKTYQSQLFLEELHGYRPR